MMFYYYFLYALSVLLVYLTGHVICSLFLSPSLAFNNYRNTFFKLFAGLFFLVTFYSLVKTGGVTINTDIILIAVLFGFITRKRLSIANAKQKIRLNKSQIFLLLNVLLFSSVFFFWKYYCLFNNGQAFPIVINSDSIYHSNIALFLNSFGIESLDTNFFYPPDGAHPYHYFEGWTIGFFSFLYKTNYWITEEGIVYPIFATIISCGTWAIIEKFSPLNLFSKIIALGTVCFSGLYFDQLSQLWSVFNLKETYSYGYNAIDEFWALKLSIAYIVALAGMIFFIEKKIVHGVIILLILPVITITLAPGILSALTVFIFVLILFKKRLHTIEIPWYCLFIPALIFLFIILFYAFFGASYNYISAPGVQDIIADFGSAIAIKTKIVLFVLRILQLLIFYTPVWLICLFSIRFSDKGEWGKYFVKLKFSFLFLVNLVILSLIMWLILSFSFGSKAYYFYASLPFVNVLSIVLLSISQETLQKGVLKAIFRVSIISLLAFFVYRTYATYSYNKEVYWNKYSNEFITEVYQVSQSIKNLKGVEIDHIQNLDFQVYSDNIDRVGYFMTGFNQNYTITSLSVLDIPEEELKKVKNINYILLAPICLFKDELKSTNKYVNDDDVKFQFIRRNKIEYLILNKGKNLDSYLQPFVKRQIVDSKSGVSFVLLDNSRF